MTRWSVAMLAVALVVGVALAPAQAAAQPARTAPLLLIMDASGSMNAAGPDGRPLIDAAKSALREVVPALPDGAPVGLRVHGHRVPETDKARGCRDTELIAPVTPIDRPRLIRAVDG